MLNLSLFSITLSLNTVQMKGLKSHPTTNMARRTHSNTTTIHIIVVPLMITIETHKADQSVFNF